ncbi:MAG: M28 family peptidase [Phycisphaerales bacterium]
MDSTSPTASRARTTCASASKCSRSGGSTAPPTSSAPSRANAGPTSSSSSAATTTRGSTARPIRSPGLSASWTSPASSANSLRTVTVRRTIVFAGWAAEEYGIIGSSEFVESSLDRLRGEPGSAAGCVAYINLDMAAMGPYFNSSSWPGFKGLIADSAKVVPQRETPK